MNTIVTWLVALMLWASPPERDAKHQAFPGWAETPAERTVRYESIATDIYEAVYVPGARLPWGGKNGPARSAALLLALSFGESGWAPDVDKGPCYPGVHGRCDGGRAACIFQIQAGPGTTLSQHGISGKTGADLFSDRKLCVQVALHMINRSFRAARLLPLEDRLNVYASGRVGAGRAGGSARMALAEKFFKHSLPPAAPAWPGDEPETGKIAGN